MACRKCGCVVDGDTITGAGTSNDPLVAATVPVGVVLPYGGTAAPAGWLLADGAAVSRVTYADLFAVLGVAYGVGDGVATFNLPDLRQRFPLGKATAGTGATLGGTGGTIDHPHTVDVPSHTHPVDPPSMTSGAASAGTSALPLVGASSDPSHTHPVDIASFTSGATDIAPFASAAANPPFQTFNFIVKV